MLHGWQKGVQVGIDRSYTADKLRIAWPCRFGSLDCHAAAVFLAEMTLPYREPGSAPPKPVEQLQQKNRGGRPRNNAASVIYGAALQMALNGTRPSTAAEAGQAMPDL